MFSQRTNWRLAQNRFTQAVEDVRARGAKLLDLTASNPTRVGLRYDSAAILKALGSERAMDYDPQAKGLLSAREAVARYYCERFASEESDAASHVSAIDPERIVLTASTSEGYSYVFRLLCNGGDELLVPKPSYPLFEFLADLQDVKLVPYPLIYDHGWQMDFHSLEKVVTPRTRGVVIVHPNNPTGSYVHAEEHVALNEFCRRHGLALIVDEVFLDYELVPSGTKAITQQALNRSAESAAPPKAGTSREDEALLDHKSDGEGFGKAVLLRLTGQPKAAVPTCAGQYLSFARNCEVLTFTLSGLSKISALPQMKVAWVITSGPDEIAAAAMARLEVIADTYLSMNAPMQWAVPELLEQRKDIQRQLLQRVQRNLAALDRQLAARPSCQRLSVEGGWNAVLRVPVTRSDEDLAIELVREHSVLVHPGHFYDFPSDGYLVLSLISPEKEFAEGAGRVLRHLG